MKALWPKELDEHWEEFSDAFNEFLTELGEEVELGTINGVRITLNRADKLHLIGYLKLLVLGVPRLLLGLVQTLLDLIKVPGQDDKLEKLEKIWDRLRDHLEDATKIPGTLLLTGFAKMLVVPGTIINWRQSVSRRRYRCWVGDLLLRRLAFKRKIPIYRGG